MSRFLIYSHDSYGLGHFRRCSLIAGGLVAADEDHEVLIVTGSPRAHSFPLPPRVDTIKLPTATKDAGGGYQPRKLRGPIGPLLRLRAGIILSAFHGFEPDTIIVDHAPTGMAGELVPLLREIRFMKRPPRVVLGLRDIIDEHHRVEESWTRDCIWRVLDHYDDILVYGDDSVTTTAQELQLSQRCRPDVTHVGYVAPAMPPRQDEDPYLLVTTGGGGDGHTLLRRVIAAVEKGATRGLRVRAITGPLLSATRRQELARRAEKHPMLDVVEFSDHMRELVASATAVISMAGYNTVVEELAAAVPALLVPRTTPRREQHVRAIRMAEHTWLMHRDLPQLEPRVIEGFVDAAQFGASLQSGGGMWPLNLGGVDGVTRHLTSRASDFRGNQATAKELQHQGAPCLA